MKTSERTVYKCDYCGKNYLMKYAGERHEKYCSKNPANRHTCFDCRFLEVERSTNDDGFSEKTFTCSKLEKELHSVKAERIGHSCLDHTERMPLECSSKVPLWEVVPMSDDDLRTY
jgi:hypothetical protein